MGSLAVVTQASDNNENFQVAKLENATLKGKSTRDFDSRHFMREGSSKHLEVVLLCEETYSKKNHVTLLVNQTNELN